MERSGAGRWIVSGVFFLRRKQSMDGDRSGKFSQPDIRWIGVCVCV
jgi:hypothetical protein